MDEVVVNANQLENSAQSTAAPLWKTTLPFTVDPVLWRFQVPKWWRNQKGETKRNYSRLGAAYVKGTSVKIASGPLLETVPSDDEWLSLAGNVIDYQRTRLSGVPTQLDLLDDTPPRELHPVRLIAPALVAYSSTEDRINRLLCEASVLVAATHPIAAQVIVPHDRLIDPAELDRLLTTVLSDRISSYFVWTPDVTEERLLAEHDAFAGIVRLIAALADRGIPVGHQYASYAISALHDVGLSAATHHLGWVDKGEPAQERGFMRSCQTYVPGVRQSLRFRQAADIGRQLDPTEYAERYCECTFCVGAFDAGQHPLDLLLEDHAAFADGHDRRTPTSRAVAANTWHYLLNRRLEVQAFSELPAVDIIGRDIDRAAALAGGRYTQRLRRLANELRSA